MKLAVRGRYMTIANWGMMALYADREYFVLQGIMNCES